MQVHIFYAKRKTVGLIITNDANLIIRAPIGTSKQSIDTIIENKQEWIKRKINEIELAKQLTKINYQEGDRFYYLGKVFKLSVINATKDSVTIIDQTLVVHLKKHSRIKRVLIDWYKKQAFEVILQRCKFYANLIHCDFNSITITSAKKRLGSCDYKGNLRFSLYIVLVDRDYIDYVIVHELCHRFYLNHSKKFWDKVRSIMPDFKQKRLWLKKNFYMIANNL